MSRITEQVEALAQPVLNDLNFELVGIEYAKGGRDHLLRTFIDKEDDVDLNDCTIASKKINEIMDESDPIPEMYYLGAALLGAEGLIKKEKIFIMLSINSFLYLSMCQLKEIRNG